MARLGLNLSALAVATLGACATSGIVVGNDGVGARTESGAVRAGVGPDDAAIGYSGERVVAGFGTDHQAVAGVRVDNAPVVVGVETQERGGPFGGVAFGF